MKTIRFDDRHDSLTVWLRENTEDNQEQRERLLRNLRKAMQEELTPRQHEMLERYFFQRRTMTQIADELGLNCSTVSRTLKRGKARLYRCLQYSF